MPPTEAKAAADVAFQLLALDAGVLLPLPVLQPDGRVLTELDHGPTVRADVWMELSPTETAPVDELGGVLAVLHGLGRPTAQRPNPWYTDPVGEEHWRRLVELAESRHAPFAGPLRRALPDLIALERMLPVPVRDDARRCHLDLDGSNLARDVDGRLVVLDWENSGPAAPVHELAILVGDHGPDDGRRLVRAYEAAGGPARITTAEDFAMAVAVQGHLIRFYARRWLESKDPEDVERSRWRLETGLGPALLTPRSIETLVRGVR